MNTPLLFTKPTSQPSQRTVFASRLREKTEPPSRWSVSYLDVLTILLVLFVSIAAKTAPTKVAEKVEPAMAPTAEKPGMLKLKQTFDQLGLSANLEQRGLVISMPQALVFAPGENELDATAKSNLRKIAEVLRGVPNPISLVGYADATPIHNQRFNDNWELAAARSLHLLDILVGEYGIAESRLSVASFGSNDPRNPGNTEEARAANRRVEVIVLDQPSMPAQAATPAH